MAPARQTRSRGSAALAAGLSDTKTTPETSPNSKHSKKSPPKGKKSTKPSTRRTRSNAVVSNGVGGASASESSNEEDEGEDVDDAEDEPAPPSIKDHDTQADDAAADSSSVKTSVEVNDQSWVGPPSKSKKASLAAKELGPDAIGFGEDFESEGEGNAEEDEDEEFDIADDDDNYDDVDKISDTSDASDAFEREVEREIIDAGEDGIDWDDVNTYRYDDAPHVNQYSMTIDLALEQDSPLHPEFSYFEELRSPNVTSPTLSRDLSHQFGAALHNHRRRHTFGSLANSDSSSSSSSSSSAGQAHEDVTASSGSSSASLGDDGSDDGATTDEDEDASDYEAVRPRVTPVIATPPTWIPTFPSMTSGSRNGRVANRSSRSGITRRRATSNPQGHSLVLRKLRLPSHKAIVQHVRTARGWTVRFELRGGHSLRWLSSPNSAASTPVTTARNSFDLDNSTERYVSRAGFDDVLQGRLFQHRYCTPRAPPQHRTTNFSRGYDLFTANSYWTPLLIDQSQLHEPASPLFDPENEIEDLIDMSAFEDENASDRGPTPVPADFKHPGNVAKSSGKTLGEPFDETSANSANYSTSSTRPSTSQSYTEGSASSIPATPSATPRKRRASEDEDHTELTPIFKRHSVRHSREVLI